MTVACYVWYPMIDGQTDREMVMNVGVKARENPECNLKSRHGCTMAETKNAIFDKVRYTETKKAQPREPAVNIQVSALKVLNAYIPRALTRYSKEPLCKKNKTHNLEIRSQRVNLENDITGDYDIDSQTQVLRKPEDKALDWQRTKRRTQLERRKSPPQL